MLSASKRSMGYTFGKLMLYSSAYALRGVPIEFHKPLASPGTSKNPKLTRAYKQDKLLRGMHYSPGTEHESFST